MDNDDLSFVTNDALIGELSKRFLAVEFLGINDRSYQNAFLTHYTCGNGYLRLSMLDVAHEALRLELLGIPRVDSVDDV